MELGDLGPHVDPQLGIEVRQRLVEQEGLGLADDRPPDRDPLALAAGQLARLAGQQLGQAQQLGRPFDVGGDFLLDAACARDGPGSERQPLPGVQPPHTQRHGDVVEDRQVGIERVGLEHHGEVAPARLHAADVAGLDDDRAVALPLEPGDDPQQGRLAAARRADQRDELAVGDLEIDAPQHLGAIEALSDVPDRQLRHGLPQRGLPTLWMVKAIV